MEITQSNDGIAHESHLSSFDWCRFVELDVAIEVLTSESVIMVTLRIVCRARPNDGTHVATMNRRIKTLHNKEVTL
jgi:hypothetical protein